MPPPDERGETGHAARIAGRGGALEQLARLGFILGDAGAGGIQDAELDHGRGAAFVDRLAIGGNGLGQLPVGGVGAAELKQRPARRRRRDLAEFDRGGDVGRRDIGGAFDVRRLVRIGGIGGEPVAQHQIGRLRAGRRLRGRQRTTGPKRKRSKRRQIVSSWHEF